MRKQTFSKNKEIRIHDYDSKINNAWKLLKKDVSNENVILIKKYDNKLIQHDSAHPKLIHPKGRHDDLLWALCLSLYGIKTNPPGISLVCTGRYDDQYTEMSDNQRIENIMNRLTNSGINITNVKIKMPGEY